MTRMLLPARHYVRFPYDHPVGLVTQSVSIDLGQAAVLAVDLYGEGHETLEDDVDDNFGLFSAAGHRRQTEVLHRHIAPVLSAAREIGCPIVYVENRWQPGVWGDSEFGRLVDRCESGHLGRFDDVYARPGYGPYAEVVTPAPDELRVQKAMYDGFFETELDSVLRNRGIRTLVCVGFSAEICLLHTAVGAMYRDYRVIVLRDCVVASEFVDTIAEQSMARWATRYYEALVGYTSTSADFIAACAACRDGGAGIDGLAEA